MTSFDNNFESSFSLSKIEDVVKDLLTQQFTKKPCLKVIKFSNNNMVFEDNTQVSYAFVICNMGNVTIKNAFLKDILPEGMTYVPYSTTINHCAPFDANPEYGCGISLGDIEVRDVLIVKFLVNVTLSDYDVNFYNCGTVCGEYCQFNQICSYCEKSNVTAIIGLPNNRFDKVKEQFYIGHKNCLSDIFLNLVAVNHSEFGDNTVVYATYDIVVRYKDKHNVTEQIVKTVTATFSIPTEIFDERYLRTDVAKLCFKEDCGKVKVSAYIKLTF